MTSLCFVVKFCMTIFVLALHCGLFLLFLLSFVVHTGRSIEGVAIGVEAVVIFMMGIRIWYYYIHYRGLPISQRMQRESTDERVFVVSTWVLSLANAIWITVNAIHLTDGFAGLPRPDFAAIAAITLVWLAWSASVHLIWIIIQEESTWLADDEKPIRWPSMSSSPASAPASMATYTPPPLRRKYGRISARIMAVQHNSPPELWDKKHREQFSRPGREVGSMPMREPARPTGTYDPKARQLRNPPPVITSQYQWYVAAGEAI